MTDFNPRGSIEANPVDNADLIWVPSGAFIMGSDTFDDEMPQHEPFLDGYYIYKTQVTVAMYRKYCIATALTMPEAPDWGWDKANLPMVNVSWHDALGYATWAGALLPTEAQWEKAARGTDGRRYPWGDELSVSNLRCSIQTLGEAKEPAPVGSYVTGASPYGVLDMAGNAWEWCSDWHDANYYAQSSDRNPQGPESSPKAGRVLRGGSWFCSDVEGDFRCANRIGADPAHVNIRIGFRCVITDY